MNKWRKTVVGLLLIGAGLGFMLKKGKGGEA